MVVVLSHVTQRGLLHIQSRVKAMSFKKIADAAIEPRKNHNRLIEAWEIIRAEIDPSMKLVILGSSGWDVEPIMREMRTWIDQGVLFALNIVPAAALRALYRHAAATVCPSVAEGFDFS